MCQMNVLEAKTNFSKLLVLLKNKDEDEIIICRNNKPVARITLIPQLDRKKAFGIAAGKLKYPTNISNGDEEIAEMFYGSEDI